MRTAVGSSCRCSWKLDVGGYPSGLALPIFDDEARNAGKFRCIICDDGSPQPEGLGCKHQIIASYWLGVRLQSCEVGPHESIERSIVARVVGLVVSYLRPNRVVFDKDDWDRRWHTCAPLRTMIFCEEFSSMCRAREWIQRVCARSLEIGDIPCDHGKLMFQARSRNQTIDYW